MVTAEQATSSTRQATLASAWNAYLKTNPPEDREAMRKGWMAARGAALKQAGFDAIFE